MLGIARQVSYLVFFQFFNELTAIFSIRSKSAQTDLLACTRPYEQPQGSHPGFMGFHREAVSQVNRLLHTRVIEREIASFHEVLSNAPNQIVADIKLGNEKTHRNARGPRCRVIVRRYSVCRAQQWTFRSDLFAQIMAREYRQGGQVDIGTASIANSVAPKRRALHGVFHEITKLHVLPMLPGRPV